MTCGLKKKSMMKCGIDGISTDGETITKRSQMETTDETRPKSEKSSCSIYQWCCSRKVQETVVVPQIQYISVCGGKTSSPNLVCSETLEDLQNAIQR